MSNNIAWNGGGGAYLENGLTLKNSVIARNISLRDSTTIDFGGGGVRSGGGIVQNCIIEENRSGYAGGGIIQDSESSATVISLVNCLIRNNLVYGANGGRGGGVLFENNAGLIQIFNCTIVSNYAQTHGGGLYNAIGDTYIAVVENTIIYGNTCGTAAYSNYYNTSTKSVYSNCCFAPAMSIVYTNVNTITNNPQFVESSSGNYRLSRESPCVNAGANLDWLANSADLDGRSRIDRFSRIVDMGCYEYLPSGSMYLVP
jgi:hypothetical protein